MIRYISLILLLITLTIFLLFMNVYSIGMSNSEKKDIEDKFIISHTEIYGKLERPGIEFNHTLHVKKFKKEGCKECHLMTEDGNYSFDYLFNIENKNKKEIKELYHKKCVGCHEKEFKKNNKVLPVRCGECHKKNILSSKYPAFVFDFQAHDKHIKTLNNKCIFCHHLYDKEEKELVYEEGTEQSCYYCHDLQKKHSLLLKSDISAATQKNLNMKKVSHYICINCHFDLLIKGEKAGPIECNKCHTGKYKTVAELINVPRMKRDQPVVSFINIEEGQMKGVPFDHSFHEKNTLSCKECHHQTLKSCKECHSLKGKQEGNWINTTNAYHNALSSHSCIGCHNKKKGQEKCSGCHHYIKNMDLQAKGPKKEICKLCHTGKKDITKVSPLSLTEINSQKIPENVIVKILEKNYEASIFPHLKIIKNLAEISNKSKVATYFHRDIQTICKGCHHQSSPEAEAKANKPPYCKSCHSINFDQDNINKPRLLAIYHRQCMGCHEKMKIKATGCSDCHKEKNVHN